MQTLKLSFLVIAIVAGLYIAGCSQATHAKIDYTTMPDRVRDEFRFAWDEYKRYAWSHDELNPLSKTYYDWYGTSLCMTPVDALDTMRIMGLNEEADRTQEYIIQNLSFDRDIYVKNFEITIRILGGLLSNYQITHDQRLLKLAKDLGNRLLPAFHSPTGMPYMYVNLRTGRVREPESNPAEIGTLVLEFGTLSRLTQDQPYYDAAKRALAVLYQHRSAIGLVGSSINVETGKWTDPTSHISGGIDSYYEYLFKCWRLFGDPECREMWQSSISVVNSYLRDEEPGGLWYRYADMDTGRVIATHYGALDAFFPAVLALSGDVDHAQQLQASSYKMWTAFGLEPEEFDYKTMKIAYDGYALRPEIIESAYYLYRITGDPKYQEMGIRFFNDLRHFCRTRHGYAALDSVISKKKTDRMQSYFLAETLKYLYLLFAPPDAIDFEHVTFNTEAHPLQGVTAAAERTSQKN